MILATLRYSSNLGDPKIGSEPIGLTPLHIVAGTGDTYLWKKLSEKLHDKNPRNKLGSTPLHFAALKGHLDICETIVEYSGVSNPKDDHGWTPLHWVVIDDLLEKY